MFKGSAGDDEVPTKKLKHEEKEQVHKESESSSSGWFTFFCFLLSWLNIFLDLLLTLK